MAPLHRGFVHGRRPGGSGLPDAPGEPGGKIPDLGIGYRVADRVLMVLDGAAKRGEILAPQPRPRDRNQVVLRPVGEEHRGPAARGARLRRDRVGEREVGR